MKKRISAALSGVLAAALLLGNTQLFPSADTLSLRSGIWLAGQDGTRCYYLFGADGTGAVCYDKTHLPMTYALEGQRITLTISGQAPVTCEISETDGVYSALLPDGTSIPCSYLQDVTEADYSRSYLAGDMTQDGNLSQYDAMLMEAALLGSYRMTNLQLTLADLNGDRIFSAADLSRFKQQLLAPPEPLSRQVMLDAIEYSQHPEYPTGCESIALYILLRFYGTDVTPAEIVAALPKGPLPYTKDEIRYGANPEKEFVGDPTTSYSYGVFNAPIAKTAELFRSGAYTKTGAALEELYPILSSRQPVIAWYTTKPEQDIVYKNSWYDYETGDLVRWPGGEHAVVVCGYDLDSGTLTYRDPNTGGSNTLSAELFRKTFDELGGRIVYYES